MQFPKHAFIALLFAFFCMMPASAVAIETGAQAPDFKLTSLQGQEVSLSDFKGRLVLLKLATTWCPTCKQLGAEIAEIGEFLKQQDVVFLEVFVQDSQDMIEKYLGDKKPPMTFHALLDDGQAYKAYNVYLIPRLLVIDVGQIVRFDTAGQNVSADEIMAMVREYNRSPEPGGSS